MAEPSLPIWVAALMSVATALLGSGGVAAVLKARTDRNIGIAQTGIEEDTAIAQRWKDLVDSQVKLLVEPMRETLADQAAKITEMEVSIRNLRIEVEAVRTKYWRAVQFIRALMNWGRLNVPDQNTLNTLPPVPAELAEDI